jgi:hypothetical protein
MDDTQKSHDRKGKWRKAKRISRHDKRTARRDPIPDDDSIVSQTDELSSSSSSISSPCTGVTPSLNHLYRTNGYRGYMDYVNTTAHCSCPSCKKQQERNLAWIKANESPLEDAEQASVMAFIAACDAEEEYYETFRLRMMDSGW